MRQAKAAWPDVNKLHGDVDVWLNLLCTDGGVGGGGCGYAARRCLNFSVLRIGTAIKKGERALRGAGRWSTEGRGEKPQKPQSLAIGVGFCGHHTGPYRMQ